ncbi:helix-turn-helix domain-containing protein [Flavobacteriaceae bacterium R38]|nr:helix-turn-helix domain-containing protein [Flavobacteriaceae bacterium R38]
MSTVQIPEHFTVNDKHQDAYIINYAHQEKLFRQKISFEYYTFSLLVEGIKEIHTSSANDKIYPFNFLVVKRGNCLMTEKLSNNSTYRSKLVLFSKDFLQEFIRKYQITISKNESSSSSLYQILAFDDYIRLYVQSISSIEISPRMQRAKVEELLIYCYEKFGSQLFSFLTTELTYPNLQQVVEEHVNENLSVEELAFLCNMSISTFKRAFYQTYDATPSKWIKNKRLELSKNDLQDVKLRASDIYLKYGFGSLSRYISAFKETYGITPKQFQQSLK